MRWLLTLPTLGAMALILAIEVRANAEPADAPTPVDVRERTSEPAEGTPHTATAFVRPASGSDVVGLVRFWETADGQVAYDIEMYGLTAGRHGFHVHETGDCSAPDATSAGGHYDPEGAPHGAPTDARRHVGDLGNVFADETGHVDIRGVDDRIALHGAHSIVGRAIVVHAEPDDLKSQPSGAAGPRVGCAVIRQLPSEPDERPREEG